MPDPLPSPVRPHADAPPRVFVLRYWQERNEDGSAWRISLYSPLLRTSRYFRGAEQLCAYLRSLDPSWPDLPDP